VYARAGHSNDARELLEKAKREFLPENAHSEAIPIAKVHAGLGEIDQAFEWLEKAFAVRSQYLVLLQVSPEFDNLHGDARFTAMVKRLGIPN
jgi:tetratricopeptide (TPR) repeat protein